MKSKNNKKNDTTNMFIIVSLFAFVVTFILTLMNNAFVPSCMLMLSLLLFSICYKIQESNKKVMYTLYVIGVLLILCSLVYTFTRIY